MNMSLQELYFWLVEVDFPSLSALWTWLVTVPWWLAILTVVFTVFIIRITWNMTFYFLNWLFDWTFEAGMRFGEWLQTAKDRLRLTMEFGKLLKKKIFG